MSNREEIQRLTRRARGLERMAAHQRTQIDEDFLRRMAQRAREKITELEIEDAKHAPAEAT